MDWRDWVGRISSWGEVFSLSCRFLARLTAALRRSDVAGNEDSMRLLRGIARQLSGFRFLNFRQSVVACPGSPLGQAILITPARQVS
jgi:hypothetical protein